MKIIKFGGKSLSNGKGINQAIEILISRLKRREQLVVACSARGNATNDLENLLEKAASGLAFKTELEAFKTNQIEPLKDIDFSDEFKVLESILEGVRLVKDYSLKTKDLVLAQGELLSIKMVSALLNQAGANAIPVDSRAVFVTDDTFGNAKIIKAVSVPKLKAYFKNIPVNHTPIISGFIAASPKGDTTTLGRNGSNYSASLLANYLSADAVESYTHVDGIYTANPDQVNGAQIINELTYREANELASFGANILHAKTIYPLAEKQIPLKVLNTFNQKASGTLIKGQVNTKGVKSITVQDDIAVISIEGQGFLGKSGVDARIFSALQHHAISIGLISQGSSERGIGFVVKANAAPLAIECLQAAFKAELNEGEVNQIIAIDEVSVITVIGQDLNGFSSAYQSLVSNGIDIKLINNTLSGTNISLVLSKSVVNKAVNLIHSQIFGVNKNINIAIFGKGTVGKSLINQIIESQAKIQTRKATDLSIFAIAGRTSLQLNHHGIGADWETEQDSSTSSYHQVQAVIDYAQSHHLENLVLIDNTASASFVNDYERFIQAGFDIISSNKIANTIAFSFYQSLRQTLKNKGKTYLYETNVGAGLPLIDTIKLLHDSGENITRIKGVFSGSLSYLFNEFSSTDQSFSDVLSSAIQLGYTEPDPREDLSGNDVARKLLVLARELDLENEFEDIKIENLIPSELTTLKQSDFLNQLTALNDTYAQLKSTLLPGEVLRYVGDLFGDLQQRKGQLEVKLVKVAAASALGQLSGSDSLFEIYTESYGERPIIIQGAGAGAAVTARGVFGDLLRIAEKK